jgi:hypothetical protein
MNLRKYYSAIDQFMKNGWDEADLSEFDRTTRAIYATQIFISMRRDSEAPAAFGVQEYVRPAYWMAPDKGPVVPLKAGNYRLVASADGFMAIALHGKIVFFRHLNQRNLPTEVGLEEGKGSAANGRSRYSLPFESDGVTPIDLDMISAEAGGMMNAFLLCQRDGESYANRSNGNLLYPAFQPTERAIPTGEASKMPPAAKLWELWRAVP